MTGKSVQVYYGTLGPDSFHHCVSTGRWTREEHQLFVKGLELYGKGWKKIASLIKTRTVVQIRTHAQKYFLKLSKARQNGEFASGLGHYGFRKVFFLFSICRFLIPQ